MIGIIGKKMVTMSMHVIRIKLREVVMTLRERQRESVKLKVQCLEEITVKTH